MIIGRQKRRRGAYTVKVLKHREAFPPFTNAHAFDVSDKLNEGDYENSRFTVSPSAFAKYFKSVAI